MFGIASSHSCWRTAKAELVRSLAPASIVNAYGPTEATVCATVWSCPDDFDGSVVPIGRPIANTRIYLLDAWSPVPFGAVGELYIGGRGCAWLPHRPSWRSVHRQPFVEATSVPERRGRYLPDGNLEFLGRNDDQVKIRGFRIEPGEIAARLCEHELVGDAVVVARHRGDQRLVAYVWPGAIGRGRWSAAASLRAHLGLPDYMVPAAFVRLDGCR
ncbi:AMP-binding protein [Neorhizobium galegae]|uniref:AMP-binding protein n=1 Tax=Neorhizobium galegae TaxID=399 RepID=UPI00349EAFA1